MYPDECRDTRLQTVHSGKWQIDFTTGIFISVQYGLHRRSHISFIPNKVYLAQRIGISTRRGNRHRLVRLPNDSVFIIHRFTEFRFAFSGLATAMRMASRILNELANFIQES